VSWKSARGVHADSPHDLKERMELHALFASNRQGEPRSTGRSSFRRASFFFVSWFAILFQAAAAATLGYTVRWNPNSKLPTVEIVGLGEKTLRELQAKAWQSADWQNLFSVYAGQSDFIADMSMPAMLGNYSLRKDSLRFTSRFPLERGVSYRAVFRPARLPGGSVKTPDIVSFFLLPSVTQKPTTMVAQIYPSADVLPENLLKFYVHFSASMQGGHIYEHIHLRDEAGKVVELPFLEIDEELWNPEMTRLTLFIDPGRIKRGVQPLEEIGPALEEGRQYTLEIDAAWHDSTRTPLREAFRKSFRVGPQDREPPTPATWKIKAPKARTRDALTVDFSEPMDHALALRVIRVADADGRLIAGTSILGDHEKRWVFTPLQSWTAGSHQLQVENTIEDLAGNNIGKAFEVDLFEGVQRRFTAEVVKLSFEVR
jgi:hypothetical protein